MSKQDAIAYARSKYREGKTWEQIAREHRVTVNDVLTELERHRRVVDIVLGGGQREPWSYPNENLLRECRLAREEIHAADVKAMRYG